MTQTQIGIARNDYYNCLLVLLEIRLYIQWMFCALWPFTSSSALLYWDFLFVLFQYYHSANWVGVLQPLLCTLDSPCFTIRFPPMLHPPNPSVGVVLTLSPTAVCTKTPPLQALCLLHCCILPPHSALGLPSLWCSGSGVTSAKGCLVLRGGTWWHF